MKPLRVDRSKVVGYLLNPAKSRGKATFFLRMGFQPERWEDLAQALKAQAVSGSVAAVVESLYMVSATVSMENWKHLMVVLPGHKFRTVWIEEPGSGEWRLITSHPA